MQTKTLKLPLSPAQVKVLTLMREGYKLDKIYRFELYIWLSKDNDNIKITKQCLEALINRKLIHFTHKVSNVSRYELTELGKTYQDKPKRTYKRRILQ